MTSVLLVPNKGADALELVGTSGIFLDKDGNDDLFPAVQWDEEYAESRETEGGFRTLARPQNLAGAGAVNLSANDGAGLQALRETWEQTINDVHHYGGELIRTPDDGAAITYDLTSLRLTGLTLTPVTEGQGHARSTFDHTCLPFGRLAQSAVVVSASGSTPLLELVVPELDGSADALCELTLQDLAGQARNFAVWGMESRYYNPAAPWPVFIDSNVMTALDSASSSSGPAADAYNSQSWRQASLGTTQKGFAYYTSSHVGRFVVRLRLYTSVAGISVRLGVAIRGGATQFKPWVTLPVTGWNEVRLGVVNIDPPRHGSHSVTFSVYGKTVTGTADTYMDWLKTYPAERLGKAAGGVGAGAAILANRYMRVNHDSVETETSTDVWADHPGVLGAYLQIPRAGGRIVCQANRNNLDTTAMSTTGDNLSASLKVTPRVLLAGS